MCDLIEVRDEPNILLDRKSESTLQKLAAIFLNMNMCDLNEVIPKAKWIV